MKRRFRDAAAGYLFLLPFLLTIGVFFVYAFVRAVVFSFTDYNLFNINNLQFVGFQNYLDLFQDDNFLRALINSVTFATVVTALQTIGALLMAAVLNQKVRGLGFFRAAYYMPSVTSSVVITLIFLWLFQRTGLINYLTTEFSIYLPLILVFLAVTALMQLAQVSFERARNLPAGWTDPALASWCRSSSRSRSRSFSGLAASFHQEMWHRSTLSGLTPSSRSALSGCRSSSL